MNIHNILNKKRVPPKINLIFKVLYKNSIAWENGMNQFIFVPVYQNLMRDYDEKYLAKYTVETCIL